MAIPAPRKRYHVNEDRLTALMNEAIAMRKPTDQETGQVARISGIPERTLQTILGGKGHRIRFRQRKVLEKCAIFIGISFDDLIVRLISANDSAQNAGADLPEAFHEEREDRILQAIREIMVLCRDNPAVAERTYIIDSIVFNKLLELRCVTSADIARKSLAAYRILASDNDSTAALGLLDDEQFTIPISLATDFIRTAKSHGTVSLPLHTLLSLSLALKVNPVALIGACR